MRLFPPVPAWDQFHPIVVHFPIALLFIAPLAVVGALFMRSWTRHLLVVAAATVVIGAAFAALATATGDASERFAEGVPGAEAVLDQHEDLAELARNVFLGLSVVIVLVSATVWRLGDRLPRPLVSWACVLYVVAHLVGVTVLANAAHEGGRLVHEFGVRTGSATASSGSQPIALPAGTETGHRDDD